jgi:hypothetical protein
MGSLGGLSCHSRAPTLHAGCWLCLPALCPCDLHFCPANLPVAAYLQLFFA